MERSPVLTVVPQMLSSSSEWKKPNQGATVTAHLVGRLHGGTVFEDQDLTFVTDEGVSPEQLFHNLSCCNSTRDCIACGLLWKHSITSLPGARSGD